MTSCKEGEGVGHFVTAGHRAQGKNVRQRWQGELKNLTNLHDIINDRSLISLKRFRKHDLGTIHQLRNTKRGRRIALVLHQGIIGCTKTGCEGEGVKKSPKLHFVIYEQPLRSYIAQHILLCFCFVKTQGKIETLNMVTVCILYLV